MSRLRDVALVVLIQALLITLSNGQVVFSVSTVTTTTLTVSWTGDASTSYTSFTIKQNNVEQYAGSTSDLQNGGTHVLDSLSPGVSYTLLVEADDGTVLLNINQPTTPLSVTGLAMTGSSSTTSLGISWSPGTGSTQTTYQISYIDETDGTGPVVVTSNSPYFISGLMPGHKYQIQVSAVSGTEMSSPSTIILTTAPEPVSLTLGQITTTLITVSWTNAAGSTQDSYEISYTDQSDGSVSGPFTTTTMAYTVDNLSAGHTYTIEVVALSGSARSTAAIITQATVPGGVVISDIDESSVSTNQMMVMWVAVTGSSGYEVSYVDMDTEGASTMTDTTTFTSTTLNNLLPGHSYQITIRAVINDLMGEATTVTQATVPAQPTLTMVSAVDESTLFVAWTTSDPNSIQDSFDVKFYDSQSTANDRIEMTATDCGLTNCTFDVGDYPAGQPFTVKVAAVRDDLISTYSYMNGNTRPATIADMTQSSTSDTSFTITWEPVSDSNTYRVVRLPEEGLVTGPFKIGNTWQFTLQNAVSGRAYTVSVYTVSGTEESLPADQVFYTTPPTPGIPTIQSTTTISLTVTWTEPSSGEFENFHVTIVKTSDNTSPDDASVIISGEQIRSATFSTLVPGAQYTISVSTLVDGNSLESNSVQANFHTNPLPPMNLQVLDQNPDSLSVSWEPPDTQPNEFSMFWAQLQGVENSRKDISAGNNPQDTQFSGLQPGTLYTVEVATTTGSGDATRTSDIISEQFYTAPEAAGNLHQVAVTTDSITVEWNAPSSPNFDTYTIQITEGSTVVAQHSIQPEGSLSYMFTSLSPASEYTVTLNTVIAGLSSTGSAITVNTSPNPPRSLTVGSKTTNSVTVSWTAPDQVAAVDQYMISVGITGETPTTVSVTSTSYTASGLRAGATYTVSVWAINSQEESESTSMEVTLIPDAAQSLSEEYVGQTSVEVSWVAPSNSDYTGFRVYITRTGSSDVVVTANVGSESTTHELTGLSAGRSYTVYIVTLSGAEESSSISMAVNTLPTSVASMEVDEQTTNSITVSWQEPSNTDLEHYEMTISPNDGGLNLPIIVNQGAALSYTFSSLRAGVIYTLSIQVVATGGAVSGTVTRDVTTKPSPVTSLAITAVSTTGIVLTWNVDPASTQQTFQVSHSTGGSNPSSDTVAFTNANSYTHSLSSLAPGYTYTIDVLAISNDEPGEAQTITQTTDPESVTSLSASVESSTTVRLTWDASSNGIQDNFEYRYRGQYVSGNTGWSAYMDETENFVVIDGLIPGETYTYEVVAVAGDRVSSARTASETQFPLPPTDLLVDTDRTSTTFVWITWDYDNDASYITQWEIKFGPFGVTTDQQTLTLGDASARENLLSGLTPGQKYTVELHAVTTGNVKSQTAPEVQATAQPECNTRPTENTAETSNSQVAADYAENTVGVFDTYLFRINATNVPDVSKRFDETDRIVRFSEGITNGTYYSISVYVISGSEISELDEQLNTAVIISNPYKPAVQADRSANQITLLITKPEGGVEEYKVTCSYYRGDCGTKWQSATSNGVTMVDYTNLQPNTQFTFNIVSVVGRNSGYGRKESSAVEVQATTAEAAPGPVDNFDYTDISSTTITLTWEAPQAPNGVITGYLITHTQINTVVSLASTARTYTFTGLMGGVTYTFTVQGVTGPGPGLASTQTVTMPISPPMMVLSEEAARPSVTGSVSQSSFTVTLVDPFSEDNGAIVAYGVIVSQSPDVTVARNVPSWAQARSANSLYYQATRNCSFLTLQTCSPNGRRRRATNQSVSFIVGADDCSEGDLNVYCNGPLNPETSYSVALRAYTADGQYSDGPFSSPVQTAADNLIWYIVGAVAACLVLVIFILMAIYLARRGLCRCGDTESGRHLKPMDMDGTMRRSSRRKTLGDMSRPVKVVDFPEHAREMAKDSDFKYSEEYEDLKHVGKDQTVHAAELPVNRSKNRFTNVLPYDQTRVKLLPTDDDDGSDYINANYMPGFNSKREFIVTQGCLPSTRDDFWRMVWEQNCRAIVMLTKCVEKGREKCDHYWPVDGEPMFYGDLQVQVLNETKCPTWIVTEFRISMGENSRKMTHFHYIDWPDFGVPKKPQSLVSFVRLVRSRLSQHGGPIVVHCSAGVGRSGAYIALDHVLQSLQNQADTVDIYGLVYSMRKVRPHMVQTEQQYICVHNCVACVLEGNEEDSPYHGEENQGYDDDEGITLE